MLTADADYTTDDLLCVCISRLVEDGEMLAQGIATPLVAAGYLLARLTHAPHVILASAIGNVLSRHVSPLGLTRSEALWLDSPLSRWDFCEASCEILPTLAPKEFFRPAQVDRFGHFNNVVIGPYGQPTTRLPGSGGIADITPFHRRVYLYVPRHNRSVFVEKPDLVSGLGVPTSERPGKHPGPRLLVSDLGIFDFASGRMRLCSIHPGASVEQVQAHTGFPVEVAAQLQETQPPTRQEVQLLREVIDPLGTRELERLSGHRRRLKLRDIVAAERGCPFLRNAPAYPQSISKEAY